VPLLRGCRHDDLPGGVPPTGLVVLRSPFTCLDRELILALRPVMVGVAADLIVAVVSLGSNRFAFEAASAACLPRQPESRVRRRAQQL